jgi:hypothetical protein
MLDGRDDEWILRKVMHQGAETGRWGRIKMKERRSRPAVKLEDEANSQSCAIIDRNEKVIGDGDVTKAGEKQMAKRKKHAAERGDLLEGAVLERLHLFVLGRCLEQGKRWGDANNGEELTEAAMGSTDRRGSRIENDDGHVVLRG